jgi:hypothetical protein
MQQCLATSPLTYIPQPEQIQFKRVVPTVAAQDEQRVLEEKLRQLMAESDRLRKREAELLKELETLKGRQTTKPEPGAD